MNLDLTPTIEVDVQLDPRAKTVLFRSTRSTLYGSARAPGHVDGECYRPPVSQVCNFIVDVRGMDFQVLSPSQQSWQFGTESMRPADESGRARIVHVLGRNLSEGPCLLGILDSTKGLLFSSTRHEQVLKYRELLHDVAGWVYCQPHCSLSLFRWS